MWSMNRFDRPSALTAIAITISFLCAIAAGAVELWEVRRRKKLQKLGKLAPSRDVVKNTVDEMRRESIVESRRGSQMV